MPTDAPSASELKNAFIQVVQKHEGQLAALQSPSGQYSDPTTGYTLYGQYAGYVAAWLWDHYRTLGVDRPDLLQQAIAGWEFYRTQTNDEGKTAVITFNQYWHHAFDEWGFYYWVGTLRLLRPVLPDATRQAWEARINLIGKAISTHLCERIASEDFGRMLDAHLLPNHFAWSLLAAYQFGREANNPALCEAITTAFHRAVDAQLECGTWLEGGTPVTGYGDVTAAALSIFAEQTGDVRVLKALERHLVYVYETLYPNFSRNDCVDGRYWYTLTPFPYTAPSYLRFNHGKAYLQRWIERIGSVPNIGHYTGLSLQGLTALTGVLDYFPDVKPPSPTAPPVSEGITEWPEITTRIARKQGWIITQSAPVSGIQSRWIFERQNITSVFHEKLGLIVGGGHSIAMPEWSSFNLIGSGMLHYVPAEAVLVEDGIRLRYSEHWGEIRYELASPNEMVLTYRMEGLQDWQRVLVHLPLWLPPNTDPVVTLGGTSHPLRDSVAIPADEAVKWRECTITLNTPGTLRYPMDGYTPYVKKGSASTPMRRQAILEIPLSHQADTITARIAI